MLIKFLYILVCMSMFTGCQTTSNPFFRPTNVPQVYLFNDESLSIEPVDLYLKDIIDIEDTNQVLDYVLSMLSQGANSSNLSPTLHEDIVLDYYVFNQGNILLNFNDAYGNMNSFDELIARNSLVLSLVSFEMIDSVEIFVGEEILSDDMGNRIGPMTSKDVLLTMHAVSNTSITKSITIYCPSEDPRYLKEETVNITLHPNRHQEELIVEYLISNASCQFLPKDTQVLDVQIHETICYVNLNNQFLVSYLPEGITSSVAIYGIVNTLTELNHISKVQILVEGEVVNNFQGTFPLKTPLSKNYEIVR